MDCEEGKRTYSTFKRGQVNFQLHCPTDLSHIQSQLSPLSKNGKPTAYSSNQILASE